MKVPVKPELVSYSITGFTGALVINFFLGEKKTANYDKRQFVDNLKPEPTQPLSESGKEKNGIVCG